MASAHEIHELNRQAFEKLAEVYAGDIPSEEDPKMRAECRKLFVESLAGKDILELGCGPGIDAWYFSEAGFRVLATDYAEGFLKIAGKRFPKLRLAKLDATDPRLPPGSLYDGIYAFGVFQHIPRELAPEALKKLRALLRPKGVLFLSLLESPTHPDYEIDDWGAKGNRVHFTCYAKSEIQALLKAAGFRGVEFSIVPSAIYENMPRLVERGVHTYQVFATTPSQPTTVPR